MDFILLMHNDAKVDVAATGWQPYLHRLQMAGKLRGGSAIAGGTCFRREAQPAPLTGEIVGFIRIEADDMIEAEGLLEGNPVYEAGGTVEVRMLPMTDG
ncbi:MAG: hypothetical protein JXQ99_11550 [Hyphomicrobiaceae bacterium]